MLTSCWLSNVLMIPKPGRQHSQAHPRKYAQSQVSCSGADGYSRHHLWTMAAMAHVAIWGHGVEASLDYWRNRWEKMGRAAERGAVLLQHLHICILYTIIHMCTHTYIYIYKYIYIYTYTYTCLWLFMQFGVLKFSVQRESYLENASGWKQQIREDFKVQRKW